ncbi:Alpha/Beta hydrolase protein [Mycena latifolia]|nr:Alpha/Beta hydrolase protein [Mycena latifolia]
MYEETPFKISIPDEKLSLLHKKLELTTLPDELADAGWDYGVPLVDVRRLVERWTNGYDWRKHEAQLNTELPQFTRDIAVDGYGTLNIHYVHKKSEIAEAIPMLFVHGWPGSFLEARKLLQLLTKGTNDFPAFHLVAMSIPGYGFSQYPGTKGFDLEQYAEVGNKLMLALGYNEYVTQGGDWGFPITSRIAKLYGGKHIKAWHTNTPLYVRTSQILKRSPNSPSRKKRGSSEAPGSTVSAQGTCASSQPSRRPWGTRSPTLPAGLLAWIYEKLVNWSDAYPWEDDEVLTWVSIYWFSRAGPTASLRIYFEAGNRSIDAAFSVPKPRPTIPLGLSSFPKDILVLPKSWTQDMGNVVLHREHESGGHFAAYERPEYLAADLRTMFGKGGPAFGVVSGKNGYESTTNL